MTLPIVELVRCSGSVVRENESALQCVQGLDTITGKHETFVRRIWGANPRYVDSLRAGMSRKRGTEASDASTDRPSTLISKARKLNLPPVPFIDVAAGDLADRFVRAAGYVGEHRSPLDTDGEKFFV